MIGWISLSILVNDQSHSLMYFDIQEAPNMEPKNKGPLVDLCKKPASAGTLCFHTNYSKNLYFTLIPNCHFLSLR